MNEKLKLLGKRAKEIRSLLETEEATKTSLVLPFISALGYDIFNPTEVVPEFTADVGTKKGEKVDYCIQIDGKIVILIEVKSANTLLSNAQFTQLYRYFSVTDARIAILTNGLCYRFFSDLEHPNKMDEKPFLELDILDIRESYLIEIKRLTREGFDLENMLEAAGELKYTLEIRRAIEQQFEKPEEDFVRFFFSKANPSGRFTQGARDVFARLVKNAFHQSITDRVTDRLRNALQREDPSETNVVGADMTHPVGLHQGQETSTGTNAGDGIVTTEQELDGYRIVRAIVCGSMDASRVTYRDAKSYMAILLDNNNRKAICRLHFNGSKKYVGLFAADKTETRHPVDGPEELYRFAREIRETAMQHARADGTKKAADKKQPQETQLTLVSAASNG